MNEQEKFNHHLNKILAHAEVLDDMGFSDFYETIVDEVTTLKLEIAHNAQEIQNYEISKT